MNKGRPVGSNPAQSRHGSVSVHIDRLVLEGLHLRRDDASRLQAAVQNELAFLLRWNGAGKVQSAALPGVVAPSIQISSPFRPAVTGREVARSVFQSLTGQKAGMRSRG